MLRNKKGFTLIELLIVIVIIGILAGIVVGIVGTNARRKANDAKLKGAVHEVQNALEQYYVDAGVYPTTAEGIAHLTTLAVPLLNDSDIYDDLDYAATSDGLTYTLSFVLNNQNETGDEILGAAPNKYYQVVNKQ